jgi:gas vesicle protein
MNQDSFTRDDYSGSQVMTFIAGAVIGAGLALLLAPATGAETRKRLGDTARRFRDQTKDRMSHARDTLNEIKDDARQAFESGREAFNQGRRQRAESQDFSEAGSPPRPM